MTPDYALVLGAIRPESLWGMLNNDYGSLVWRSDDPKPTQEMLDAAWPDVEYQREYAQVEAERRARYQVETDGMFFAAQREGGDLSEWEAAVAAIKDSNPYPIPPAA